MHKLINPLYFPILDIYANDIPDFLFPFLDAKVIQRLSDISQACWLDYCKFYDYSFRQSRLDHSFWVALVIWNFTKDKKQTLAGLFHDVSHSVFSHVWDFLLWDPENQESSERYTTKLLSEDPVIIRELEKLWINLWEVDDYTKYTIADNPWPQLSADRLEYTLSTAMNAKTKRLQEIKNIYDNIKISSNEKNEDELVFEDTNKAEEFWNLSLSNDESYFSSYDAVVGQSFLSEILRYMLENKLISNMDMYKRTESILIEKIYNSQDQKLLDMREYFSNLSQYKIYRQKPQINNYFVSSKTKRRFIDPLTKTSFWLKRLSDLSQKFKENIDYHINRKEEWIAIDYNI
jgi:uncharacterized protein